MCEFVQVQGINLDCTQIGTIAGAIVVIAIAILTLWLALTAHDDSIVINLTKVDGTKLQIFCPPANYMYCEKGSFHGEWHELGIITVTDALTGNTLREYDSSSEKVVIDFNNIVEMKVE